MPVLPHEKCLHGYAHPLGMIMKVPPPWLTDAILPNDGTDLESGWCRTCEHYLWRELGSTYWTALMAPSS
jgi:hypothetical protein